MGPPETGWQQLGAPTAPLLCQLQSWGSGRRGAQRRAASVPIAPCKGERAAQVFREAAPHTTLHHNKQLRDVSSPWMEETPCQATEPSWVPVPPHAAPALLAAVEQGPGRKAELWSPSPGGFPKSPGGPAELGTRHLFVGHQEKQDKVGQAARPGPHTGYKDAGSNTPGPTIAFMLLLRQEGGTGPPLSSHTWPPQTAHPVPRRGWRLTSGSRCILCPAGWSGGGTGGRRQISRLLTALVILSTPRRRRGVCLAAWPGTGGLPWSRWPSYINRLPPRHQWGRDGESGTARLRPEPCLALTQLQQASARRGGGSGDTLRSGQGAISSRRPPWGGLPQSAHWEDGLRLRDLDRPCSSQLPDRQHMAWVSLQREE